MSLARLRPQEHTGPSVQVETLPVRPDPPFVYAHSAMGWTFDPTVGWIPQLNQIRIQAGGNGVENGPNGQVDANKMFASLAAKGLQIIHPNHPGLGPYARYDRFSFPAVKGGHRGRRHVTEFEVPVQVAPGILVWENDRAGYLGFLAYLVEHQIIHPMDPAVYGYKMNLHEQGIDSIRARASGNPAFLSKLDEAEARHAEMERAWECMRAGEVYEPPAGKGGPKMPKGPKGPMGPKHPKGAEEVA